MSCCVQVVFDSLFGAITNSKLQLMTLEFVLHICSKYAITSSLQHILLLIASCCINLILDRTTTLINSLPSQSDGQEACSDGPSAAHWDAEDSGPTRGSGCGIWWPCDCHVICSSPVGG